MKTGFKMGSGHSPNFFFFLKKKEDTSSLDIKERPNQAGGGLSGPDVHPCSCGASENVMFTV